LVGPNQEGLDAGDVAGFAAEILLDPMTYASFGMNAVTKAAKALKAAGLFKNPVQIAKRLGKPVYGNATARHALTPREVLDDAIKADPLNEERFLNAVFKGKSAGKTMADLPQDIARQLDEPVGGMLNIGVPFMEHTERTLHNPKLAEALDKTLGNLRYGTTAGRALNTMFSSGHTQGKFGESRVLQESTVPVLKQHEDALRNEFNQRIARLKSMAQSARDDLAKDYGLLEQNPKYQTTLLFEGYDPNDPIVRNFYYALNNPPGTAGTTKALTTKALTTTTTPLSNLSKASEELRREHRMLEEFAKQTAREARLPVSDLNDLFAEHNYRHIIPGPAQHPAPDSIKDVLSKREAALKNVPLGTTQISKAFEMLAPHEAIRRGEAYGPLLSDDMLRQLLRDRVGIPKKGLTEKGMQKLQQLHEEFKAGNITEDEAAKALKEIKKEESFDRLKYLIESAKKYTPEQLSGGLFLDPVSSLEIATNAIAKSAARSRAFQELAERPDVLDAYVKSGSKMIPMDEAYKRLGLDPKAPNADPNLLKIGNAPNASPNLQNIVNLNMVPEQLVADLLPLDKEAKTPTALRQLFDKLGSLTQWTKAFQTGSITSPSFHVRNRFSGAATNAYTGTTPPLSALQGLLNSVKNAAAQVSTGGNSTEYLSPAKLLARGMSIPGLHLNEALQQQAKLMGRTLRDEADASNFVRELLAGAGGSTQAMHSADNMIENLFGEGQFLGGLQGPSGPDAFSYGKILDDLKEIGKIRDWNGLKELFMGAKGSDIGNQSVKRAEHTSPFLKAGEKLSEYVEAQNRVNPWLDQVLQGVDPIEAMDRVNRAQVNYHRSNYTPFENEVLTTLIPYYKFGKGSALAHADELLTKPGGALSHLIQTTGTLNDKDEIIPAHVKEKLAIPINSLPLPQFIKNYLLPDDPETKRYLSSLGLAYEDPLTWITGQPGGLPFNLETLREGLGRLNPVIKAIGELLTGRSFFQRDETGSGRLLTEQDPPLGRLLANLWQLPMEKPLNYEDSRDLANRLSGAGFGVPVEVALSNSPFSRFLTTAKNLTDPRPNTMLKKALNAATGLRLEDVAPGARDAVLRGLQAEQIKQMPYAESHTEVYVPKRQWEKLSNEDLKKLEEFRLLERARRRRNKARQAERQRRDLEELLDTDVGDEPLLYPLIDPQLDPQFDQFLMR
jgi:hypothetical protein